MRILAAVLFAFCILALGTLSSARAQAPIDFSGTWWSERCSKIDLKVGPGGLLSGNFTSPGVPTPYPLTGFRAGRTCPTSRNSCGCGPPISPATITSVAPSLHIAVEVERCILSPLTRAGGCRKVAGGWGDPCSGSAGTHGSGLGWR